MPVETPVRRPAAGEAPAPADSVSAGPGGGAAGHQVDRPLRPQGAPPAGDAGLDHGGAAPPQRVFPARHASGGGQRHRHPLRGQPGYHGGAEPQLFHQPGPDGETYASSHFLVGLDGEVLQNVPLNEVAYCSNQRNDDTISIECCHPDDSGEFTSATYESLGASHPLAHGGVRPRHQPGDPPL